MKNLIVIMFLLAIALVPASDVFGGQPYSWGNPYGYGHTYGYGQPYGHAPYVPQPGYGYFYHERTSSDCCNQTQPAPSPSSQLVITNNNTPQFGLTPQLLGQGTGSSGGSVQDIANAMAALKLLEYLDVMIEQKKQRAGVFLEKAP